jgi:hypothetical protein
MDCLAWSIDELIMNFESPGSDLKRVLTCFGMGFDPLRIRPPPPYINIKTMGD